MREVRSIQTLPRPKDRDAAWVAAEYIRWLARAVWPLIHVERQGEVVRMQRLGVLLLELTADGPKAYRITGGLLAWPNPRGRFEFSEGEGATVVADLREFVPALPWIVYQNTQLPLHVLVMHRFGEYLRRLA